MSAVGYVVIVCLLVAIVAFVRSRREQAPQEQEPETQPYVQQCLTSQYEEQKEDRAWDSDPAFRSVLDALNAGDNSGACREAEALVPRFGDFADIYYWWGKALLRLRQLDRARDALTRALEHTRQKHCLCNLLGEVECEAGRIGAAVYWWAQGVHCQESLCDQRYGGEDVTAYLSLSCLAQAFGLSDCANAFQTRVNQIGPGGLQFSSGTTAKLLSLARAARGSQIPQVLRQLVTRYIVPRQKVAKADPGEINQLIRRLDQVDEFLGLDCRGFVEAANRLGDLGDTRALQVLAKAASQFGRARLQAAAREAMAKIREKNQ